MPGLTFQACLETGDVAFPFEIDIILYTNRDKSQHVKFGIATASGWPSTEVDGVDIASMHTYAIEWSTAITWYIDGVAVVPAKPWRKLRHPSGPLVPSDRRCLQRQRHRSRSGAIARLCPCRLGPKQEIEPIRRF